MMLLNMGNDFVVLLRESTGRRALPISIGQFEAQAIAVKLNAVDVPRPLTHDLMFSLIERFESVLLRVEITDLRDDTFYAQLMLRQGTDEMVIDARPSDAIALALRTGAPILVAEAVMDRAGVLFTDEDDGNKAESASPQEVSAATILQALQQKLTEAVEQEHYEEAARLRDQIRKLCA